MVHSWVVCSSFLQCWYHSSSRIQIAVVVISSIWQEKMHILGYTWQEILSVHHQGKLNTSAKDHQFVAKMSQLLTFILLLQEWCYLFQRWWLFTGLLGIIWFRELCHRIFYLVSSSSVSILRAIVRIFIPILQKLSWCVSWRNMNSKMAGTTTKCTTAQTDWESWWTISTQDSSTVFLSREQDHDLH